MISSSMDKVLLSGMAAPLVTDAPQQPLASIMSHWNYRKAMRIHYNVNRVTCAVTVMLHYSLWGASFTHSDTTQWCNRIKFRAVELAGLQRDCWVKALLFMNWVSWGDGDVQGVTVTGLESDAWVTATYACVFVSVCFMAVKIFDNQTNVKRKKKKYSDNSHRDVEKRRKVPYLFIWMSI